jgi:uncharacterized protein YceH (UPF0502 family)
LFDDVSRPAQRLSVKSAISAACETGEQKAEGRIEKLERENAELRARVESWNNSFNREASAEAVNPLR